MASLIACLRSLPPKKKTPWSGSVGRTLRATKFAARASSASRSQCALRRVVRWLMSGHVTNSTHSSTAAGCQDCPATEGCAAWRFARTPSATPSVPSIACESMAVMTEMIDLNSRLAGRQEVRLRPALPVHEPTGRPSQQAFSQGHGGVDRLADSQPPSKNLHSGLLRRTFRQVQISAFARRQVCGLGEYFQF